MLTTYNYALPIKAEYDGRERIKNMILARLYEEQFKHWNQRLQRLINKNLRCWGKTPTPKEKYAIYYRRKKWLPVSFHWSDQEETPFCLSLHPKFPEMELEMATIAEELEQIVEEKNQVTLFLSSLTCFACPPRVFKKILGDILFCHAEKLFTRYYSQYETKQWNSAGEFSLKTFVKNNTGVLKLMKQRLLINLMTLDSTTD